MVSFLLLCLINLILPVFIDKETINMALFCEHSSVIYNGEWLLLCILFANMKTYGIKD